MVVFQRVFMVVLSLVVLALGLTASAQSNYFAFKIGNKWSYSNGEVQTITTQKVVNGMQVVVLAQSLSGTVASETYYQVGPNGVLMVGTRVGGKDYLYNPPLTLYPAPPLTPGMQWSSVGKSPFGTLSFSSRITGSQGVVTPAGRFNALVVQNTVATSSGATTVQNFYFVPGVGIVRIVTQDGGVVDLVSR
jgi:hypothetical protein